MYFARRPGVISTCLALWPVLATGCSKENLPSHQLSTPTVVRPGEADAGPPIKQPVAKFDLPKAALHPDEKVEIGVSLDVPPDSKVPEAVEVGFYKGKTGVGSTMAEFVSQDRSRPFKLKAVLKTPPTLGKYALRATFVYNTFEEAAGQTSSKPKTTYLTSPDTDVEVVP